MFSVHPVKCLISTVITYKVTRLIVFSTYKVTRLIVLSTYILIYNTKYLYTSKRETYLL